MATETLPERLPEQVSFNVGGTRFTTTWETLQRVPGTKLSGLYGEDRRAEYYFDRNPSVFGCILDYYRTGVIHLPENVCGNQIREELAFWEISPNLVSRCCWRTLYRNSGAEKTLDLLNLEIPVFTTGRQLIQMAQRVPTFVWNVMEYPQSSLLAKVL